jgi:predicted small metal-binding protein
MPVFDAGSLRPRWTHDGRERLMAKSAACADLGMDCPGNFTVETEDELMKHLAMHASAAHPELEMTPEVMEQLKGAVKTV